MSGLFHKLVLISIGIALAASCAGGNAKNAAESAPFEERGAFSADSAYGYVARQVLFGPRVPGTGAHKECGDWLAEKLMSFGADTVMLIGSEVTTWDGTTVPVRNILARFRGASKHQTPPILLAAHYDTRPWADHDSDPAAREYPFDGANDGASGVGVILEIARNIGIERPATGIDILFTDVEDYGAREGHAVSDDTWCLGSRQFAEYVFNNAASLMPLPRWGILLDMVGGRDARFPREYFSTQIAPTPTAIIWDMAGRMGLRGRFPVRIGGAITDDHIPLSQAGIPTADIIESDNPHTGSFPPTWHTTADNIDNIDAATLSDVGRVVLNVIYNEK